MGVPAPRTSFVGRRRELAALRRLLGTARLLTLTGTGGSGKTRLARKLAEGTRAGLVAWVDLAQLRDPAAVAPAVERAMGIAGDGTLIPSTVVAALGGERALVVLDNCEHLVHAAETVAERLLATGDNLTVLATSRVPLGIAAEVLWRVPPLSLPEVDRTGGIGDVLHADAVRLFLERSIAAGSGITLDEITAPQIVAICHSVEGLPLAIEIAAARTRHLSVAELHARLRAPLGLLVGNPSEDPRHRTLQATIDWSHALLDEPERRTFRRLAVFAGGFTLAEAEAVCHDVGGADDIVASVTGLVDKSLVEFAPADDRYRLLEPVREYAEEHLRQSGEQDAATGACARYLVRFATVELAPERNVPGADASLRSEFANAAAVLPWLIQADPASALHLLTRFAGFRWTAVPVHLSVVSDWLSRALDAYPARDGTRARALISRAILDREVNDDGARIVAMRRAVDEALVIARELGDRPLEIAARHSSASVAVGEGPPERAIALYSEVLPVLRPRERAMALSVRCVLKQLVGDGAGAREDLDRALAAWAEHDDPLSAERSLTLMSAADIAFRTGKLGLAAAHLREAILIRRDHGESPSPGPFELLAHLAAVGGEHERALRLASFADRIRCETGRWPSPFYALADRSWLAGTERALGPRASTIRKDGRRMSTGDAITYALEGRLVGGLTARERAVADLVAKGLADKEIAACLAISARTAENHVLHIRTKLGLRSRAQIGRWFAEAPGSASG